VCAKNATILPRQARDKHKETLKQEEACIIYSIGESAMASWGITSTKLNAAGAKETPIYIYIYALNRASCQDRLGTKRRKS
jgi:hypothetical protein